MPHKGLPNCRLCGHRNWLPLVVKPRYAKILCYECGAKKTTRSIRGVNQMRESMANLKAWRMWPPKTREETEQEYAKEKTRDHDQVDKLAVPPPL